MVKYRPPDRRKKRRKGLDANDVRAAKGKKEQTPWDRVKRREAQRLVGEKQMGGKGREGSDESQ